MGRVLMVRVDERAGLDADEVLDVVDVAARRLDRRAVVEVDGPAQLRGGHVGAAGERHGVADRVGGAAVRSRDHRHRRGADRDLALLGVGQAARVADPQADVDVSLLRVRAARGGARRVVERAVAVEVPGVGEGVLVGVGRAAGVEVDLERRVARLGRRCERGGRRRVGVDRADAPDRPAADVGVVEVARRAHLEVDRRGGLVDEDLPRGRVRRPVRAGEHDPDAAARVVGEEHRALVGGRERAARVELDARDRGGADRAALGGDLGAVVVRVQRREGARVRVQVVADAQADGVVAALAAATLVARPAVVADLRRGVGNAVELLPGQPADVADVGLRGPRPEREAERIAEAVGDDPAGVDVTGAGVGGQRVAGVRIDADHGAVEPGRIGARAQVLAAQRAALGGRRGLGAADRPRRVAARVDRRAVLAVVGERVAGAVAGGGVEGAVGAELEVADRVARVLLAPLVADQRHLGAVGQDLREPAADHAAVALGARRVGAVVVPARGSAADSGVVRVERVDVRAAGRELGVEHHAEQAAVVVERDVLGEVRVDRRGRVLEAVEDLDHAVELADEHAAVGREGDRGRGDEVVEDLLLDELVRDVGGGQQRVTFERTAVVEDVGLSGRCEQQEQPEEQDGEEADHDAATLGRNLPAIYATIV